MRPTLSICVPVYNEAENLPLLHEAICKVVDPHGIETEILLVDDVSTDGSWPAIESLVERGMRPRIEYLARIVMDLSGCEREDPLVMHCVGSIQAQCLFYMPNPIAARLGLKAVLGPDEVDALADHIAAFSIAGIRDATSASRARRRQTAREPVPVRAVRTAERRR